MSFFHQMLGSEADMLHFFYHWIIFNHLNYFVFCAPISWIH